jgi:hypothetical protein
MSNFKKNNRGGRDLDQGGRGVPTPCGHVCDAVEFAVGVYMSALSFISRYRMNTIKDNSINTKGQQRK